MFSVFALLDTLELEWAYMDASRMDKVEELVLVLHYRLEETFAHQILVKTVESVIRTE